MARHYAHLNSKTRGLMLRELALDIPTTGLYLSPWLNGSGRATWAPLLMAAISDHDEAWLAKRIRVLELLEVHECSSKPGKIQRTKVPCTAAEALAQVEFNRYYCRAVCLLAMTQGTNQVEVCRDKVLNTDSQQSEADASRPLDAERLLEDLREFRLRQDLGVPGGPGSGLTLRLPPD